jgi:hypothetical protein
MNEDKIIDKLIEHDVVLEKLSPVIAEVRSFREEQTMANDQMLTILKRLDEERLFTVEWIRRVEEDLKQTRKTVELHEMEFKAVKERLAM